MSNTFGQKVKAFIKAASLPGTEKKYQCLLQLKITPLAADKYLQRYHDALLFTCAFPSNKKIHRLAESELKRITAFLEKKKNKDAFLNSGMPFTPYHSCFSHDFTHWLLQHRDCHIRLDQYKDASLDLNDVLKLTLPAPERSETTARLPNDELLDALKVLEKDRLLFLVTELSKLNSQPLIKDHLYESLGVYTRITPHNKQFSVTNNRLLTSTTYYFEEPTRSFDHKELLNRSLNNPATLSEASRKRLITVIKNSMALTDRETDTVTFMEETSLRYYELEQGIAVAIYGMTAARQLPYESYVGYTLLVNGFPVAYGGAWVFGPVANFGINIFEAYRGGGSGYILCQLLRLYRQVFGISCFEIEPYQFGLDNPDGIKTGAFWFYYKYGFRPKDKVLLKLALKEKEKIKTDKNYRTTAKTLVRFTGSNMVLQFGSIKPVQVYDITGKLIQLISKRYKSNTAKAEADAAEKFKTLTGREAANEIEAQVLKEVALWAEAMKIKDEKKLQLLARMVSTKPADLYAYQQLLLEFFTVG